LFQLSKKSCYGLKAIFELTVAYGKGPITTSLIAEKQTIPVPFLEQILYELRKGGVIESKRGPGGGHKLARRPEDITFGSVIQVLEGPVFLFDCLSEDYDTHTCQQYDMCPSRLLLKKIAVQIRKIFETTTLVDLFHIWVEEVRKK